MVLEDQLRKYWFFRFKGAFSVRKNSRSSIESISYAAKLLDDPANLVLIFPQGRLQSMHVSEPAFQKGVFRLIEKIQGPCQVIYCATVLEYLESFKPTAHFYLLDCGTAKDLDLKNLEKRVSDFHQQALQRQVRE